MTILKTCPRGHEYIPGKSCPSCRAEWRAANKDRVRASASASKRRHRDKNLAAAREYARRRYAADPERFRARSREWKAANPEKKRASYRKWLAANIERERQRAKAAHASDRPKARAAAKRWRKANPEKVRAIKNLRRARRLAAGGEPFTVEQWNEVVERFGGLCAYCGEQPWEHREHVVPLSRGGKHCLSNLVPACANCNHRKFTQVWQPIEKMAEAYGRARLA